MSHESDHVDIERLLPNHSAASEQSSKWVAPLVVEAAEETSRFQNSPVSILCPGCASVVDRYECGLPPRLARFQTECPTCEVDLQRWSAVACDAALETLFSQETLQEITKTYWDEHLWAGITTGEDCPRTWEYSEAYTAQAAELDWDWEVRCPLCRQSLSDMNVDRLEYHHWRRDPDQGICLCRSCHDAISGGMPDNELDWIAQRKGLKDKHDVQVARLALREQRAAEKTELNQLCETLVDRYHLVQSVDEVQAILRQTLYLDDQPEILVRAPNE